MHWIDLGDGLMACPEHPDELPFAPHIGCQLPHDAGPEVHSPGEGEQACAEAEKRGLPDGYEAEALVWRDREEASRDEAACRRIATLCERIAERLADLDDCDSTADADARAEAREWLRIAAPYRAAALKAQDIKSKLHGKVSPFVLVREKRADRERKLRAAGKASN